MDFVPLVLWFSVSVCSSSVVRFSSSSVLWILTSLVLQFYGRLIFLLWFCGSSVFSVLGSLVLFFPVLWFTSTMVFSLGLYL